MGSSIYCLPLNDIARKYVQELKPDIILPQGQPRDLTYKDLIIIFNRLRKWGWCVEGDCPNAKEFDVDIYREIDGNKGRNLYITLWIKEDNGNPCLMFHKGCHSIGLLIAKEIAKLCGSQFVFDDSDVEDCHIVTGETDLTSLMNDWLKEDLYGDYWQQEIE